MFPGLKADQCGLTAVSNEGKRRASSSREALQTPIGQSCVLLGPLSSVWRGAVDQKKKVSPTPLSGSVGPKQSAKVM